MRMHARTRIKLVLVCCLVSMAAAIAVGASNANAAPRSGAGAPVNALAPTPAPSPPPLVTSLVTPTPSPTPSGSASQTPSGPPTSPSATPSPSPPPDSGTDQGGCGFFDVTCRISHAVTGWFKGLVTGAINPVFDALGKSLLATPRLDQSARVSGLWTGSLVVADAVFVLLVMAGGILVMGHQTLQASYTVKDIAPRLVLAFVLANASLLLIGQAIDFANGLSAALLGQGVDPTQTASQLKRIILHAINPPDVGEFIVIVIVSAVLLGTILLIIYIVRIMLMILLIAAAPLALACHALPQTEHLAKLWWRAIGGVLAIQVAQSLVFIAAMRVFFTTDAVTFFGVHTPRDQFNIWITVCLLYVLVRIPSWISRMIWQGGLSASPIVRTAKTVAMLAIFRNLLPRRTRGRTNRRRRRPRQRRP
jgi:hypothetical protein